MQRREFLRNASITAAISSVPVAASASVAHARSRAEPIENALKKRVESLESKFDDLSTSQKKTMRILMIATGISLGLDLSLVI